MTRHDVDERIRRLARSQHGVFSRNQALAAGAGKGAISRRLDSGLWVAHASRVYGLVGAPDSREQQCKAAELTIDRSAIGGRAGLELHGLIGESHAEPLLWVPARGTSRSALATVRQTTNLRAVRVRGIRTVTVEQAIIDCVPLLPIDRVERAIDDAVMRGQTTIDRLVARYTEVAPGRPRGIATYRDLLAKRLDDWCPTESELEALTLRVLRRAALPPIECQARFPWRTSSKQRVDLLIPEWKLIIEADGRSWHGQLASFDRDRERDLEAMAHGYRVCRVTWHMLKGDPVAVVRRILDAGRWMVVPA